MIRAAIRRPVAITMAYACVALLGYAAWRNVPIEFLPDSRLPSLTVSAFWGGGSAEVVEAFLTSPIEGLVQQLPGVDSVTSTSTETGASVRVMFERGTDMNLVRLELMERLAVLRRDLPATVQISVSQEEPREFAGQRRPFLSYDVTGPYSLDYLHERVDEVIAREIRQLVGVAAVDVTGGRQRLLEVVVDETRANALGVTPQQITAAINGLELVGYLGSVTERGLLLPVAIRDRPVDPEDVLDAVIVVGRHQLVRVRDVATIHDTYADPTSHFRINGNPAVSMTVRRTPGTNLVAVADAVKARIAELEPLLPPGVRLILRDDESVNVRAQLSDLRNRALGSAAVIFLVLLVFLRSFRSSAIIFATIAFSILLTLNLVYFGGFTLNALTLMGMAMGFGLIVDNAIVVLENIYRRRGEGEPAEVAAERGTREVVTPILAATFTTVIVLIPFVYMQGELAVYYIPLALVVGFSLIASLFVAFTFIPALAGRMLRKDVVPTAAAAVAAAAAPGAGSAVAAASPAAAGDAAAGSVPGSPSPRPPLYVRIYAGLIGLTLRHPWWTVAVAASTLVGSYYLFDQYVTRDTRWFAGIGQRRTTININIRQPRGTALEDTDELARYFEERLARMPEIEDFVTRVSAEAATIDVTFPEELEHGMVPIVTHEQLYAFSLQFGGTDVRVYGTVQTFYGGAGGAANYSIRIFGFNYERVRDIAEDIAFRLRQFARVRDVDTNATGPYSTDRATEIAVVLHRDRLGLYGVSATDVTQRISAALRDSYGGATVRLAGEERRLEVRLAGNRTMDVEELEDLILPTPNGGAIRLGDVATLQERRVHASVQRANQQYERTIAYEFRGPNRLGDAIRDAVVEATDLPPGYRIEARRSFLLSEEEQRQIWTVLAASIVLVFMVTAMFFESIRQPLCVLLAVPMALVGVFLLFFYLGAQFNREAYIGVIMMGGIVVNNAIILVARYNHLRREEGMPLEAALVRGTLDRVRPILMTSATTVIGLLPLVLFSENVNANIWNALAYTLMGGMTSSTLFTLTVTPALYLLFERGVERRRLAAHRTRPLGSGPEEGGVAAATT